MPFPPFAPSVFFDDADIEALIEAFSERVRHSADLRPAMDALVGNRWEDAEHAARSFLATTMLLDGRPDIDGDFLARAVRVLDAESIDGLSDILLECALVALPLSSAAAIAEVGSALARLLKGVVAQQGVARQRLLLKARARLEAGALMNRF